MANAMSIGDITIAPAVRETASEDGAVLLDPEQGICFSLNPVGLKIWEMLKKQYSVDQIADAFEREFHLPRAELLSDISEFLTELEAKHLIHHGSHQVAKQGWLAKILPWRKERASLL